MVGNTLKNEELNSILEILSDVNVYTVNTDTFKVEYISKKATDNIDITNLNCWEAIYGLDRKCPFCHIGKIKENQKVEFEVFNELYNEWYNINEKIILSDNDNKTLKYSAWTNISALKQAQNDLTETYAQLVIKSNEIEKLNSTLQERVKVEVAKNKQKDDLLFRQSKHAQMGEMIGTIAHQIKQPLGAINIISSSMVVKQELGLDFDIEKECGSIENQVAFAIDTIELFRNFFNPNKKPETISLIKTVNQCLYIIKDLCTKITIIKEFDESIDDISIYPNEIIQVCMNIIKNAKDIFDEKNLSSPIIKIIISKEDNFQVIKILDNAGGVPEDIKNKIFDPYFTTKDEKRGTGIGLNLSKIIITEKHEGQISVENAMFIHNNESHTGACFILKLPILKKV